MKTVVFSSRPLPGLKLAAALVAAVAFSSPGFAQSRLSLADRVAKLEAQASNNTAQATQMELLQRLNDLQAEIQQLRSQLETQGFELEQLKKRQRDQYLDLDSRLRSQTGQTVRPNPTSMGDLPVSEPVQDPGAFTPATAPTVPAPVASAPTAPAGNERADYDVAFDALKRGQYSEASKKFEAFLAKYPSSASTDVANYWLGESYYVTQRYAQALKTFQGVLANFPQSKKAPDSLLKVGFCHYQLGDKAKASSTLKTVIERYPDQPVAKLAEGRLRMLQLN
jgi:tol-pal system protein YbgF